MVKFPFLRSSKSPTKSGAKQGQQQSQFVLGLDLTNHQLQQSASGQQDSQATDSNNDLHPTNRHEQRPQDDKSNSDTTSNNKVAGQKIASSQVAKQLAQTTSNGGQKITVASNPTSNRTKHQTQASKYRKQKHYKTTAESNATPLVGVNLGKNANASARAIITTNSSNKTVITTPLPPHEIEVTEIDGNAFIECPLCVILVKYETTPNLVTCGHRTCFECMQRYLKTEINHSRLKITCPICSEPLMQDVIRTILKDDKFYFKYESFMLRKVLAAEPDTRWCPAPDCGYAVLANGCASCPRLVCEREGCNTAFCYHCKQEWHPNQTCSAASIQRNKRSGLVFTALNISDLIEESSPTSGPTSNGRKSHEFDHTTTAGQQPTATPLKPDDIKECPVCSSRIVKMNDGSCNHMTCSICETEFCWLCLKEINDLHYFSPSGCTFWGKKPWSRKKKLLWRLGMLVGAPVCIIFIAGIAVPAIVIGIPVWAARKLHARLEKKQFSVYRKNAIITGGVLLSFVVSPLISAMALAVGVPILLGYVYGVVPLSLCRSSRGCLSPSPSVDSIPQQFLQNLSASLRAEDVNSVTTATSQKLGNPSIGAPSLYMSNISLETNSIGHITNVEREDRESASNAALAGSIMSSYPDDANSTKALAGSIVSKESGGYTLVPAEIHSQHPKQSISTSSTTTATTH